MAIVVVISVLTVITTTIVGDFKTSNVILPAFAQQVQQAFTANLTGQNEVPPVTTTAFGGINLNLSPDKNRIDYIISAKDPNGSFNVTGADIHLGKAHNNGPHIIWLTMIPCTIETCGVPIYIGQGSIREADLQGQHLTISDLVNLMKTGGAYVDVHTTRHPNGEIRGQILPG